MPPTRATSGHTQRGFARSRVVSAAIPSPTRTTSRAGELAGPLRISFHSAGGTTGRYTSSAWRRSRRGTGSTFARWRNGLRGGLREPGIPI